MKYLFILNDGPYGNERSYNGLRLALSLSRLDDTELKVFLIGDAVGCSVAGQKPPSGFYNIERMLVNLTRNAVSIGVCGSCREARAIGDERLIAGVRGSSMEELTEWTRWAEQVLVF